MPRSVNHVASRARRKKILGLILDKIGPNSAEWYLAYSFQIFPPNHPMKLIPAAKTIGPINSKANADKSFIFI